MRRFALLIALACCLIGVAAQPASAQQGQWAAARQQRRAMMRARRQAAARAYGAQGHSQAHPPAQRANGQAGAGAAAHPPATAASANSGGTRPNEPRPNDRGGRG